jgi:hypothetical protein
MNALKRLLAPRKQVKKKSLSQKRDRSELELLHSYRRALAKCGVDAPSLDLDNEFYWMFRLSGLIAQAHQKFDEINRKHFSKTLPRPKIIFCNRSTGGYYNKTRHTIGISLAMTVELGDSEFFETLLHEIAHIAEQSHSPRFYQILTSIGGKGKKAPMTILLQAKRERFIAEHYSVHVRCPHCNSEYRYRTRRALRYACRSCCIQYGNGKYDARFRLVLCSRDLQVTA